MPTHTIPLLRVLSVAVCILVSGLTAPSPASAQPPDVEVMWAAKVPMRDGVELNATIYRPLETEDPLPDNNTPVAPSSTRDSLASLIV